MHALTYYSHTTHILRPMCIVCALCECDTGGEVADCLLGAWDGGSVERPRHEVRHIHTHIHTHTYMYRYARQGEALKLIQLLGRCVRRGLAHWRGSSKVGAAALPSVPLSNGV